jgi:pyridinium-3,5-bisthiocarboxylic acid mononucleotide nickel chelatase
MTRVAWFHCFNGVAGDMTLGALLHAGADLESITDVLDRLPMSGWSLAAERVMRNGIASTRAVVQVHDDDHRHRPWRDIEAMLDKASLPARIDERARAVFRRLAKVEGAIHGVASDDVEFHEVGSLDAIVDVVGACAALESLAIDEIVCSPITTGLGTVRGAHGLLPNPAPAVVALLKGLPTVGVDVPLELATPTGVALMVTLATNFGPLPSMVVDRVGYGAGTRELEGRPNVVQVVIGDATPTTAWSTPAQPVVQLEANVDDITGEVLAHTIAALLAAGAHDAWVTPIVMKKGRPAYIVSVLCDPGQVQTLGDTLVRETGTLGVRGRPIDRWPQARSDATVYVDGEPIRVKLSSTRAKVEHDDALAAAQRLGRPLRDVLRDAEHAATSPERP